MEIVRKSVRPLQSNNNFYPTIQGIKQTAVGCFKQLEGTCLMKVGQ